jgi:cysteinyl-tRNA synthetase
MSWQHLGEVFDIHGGGIDLVFPHHENEIAQSRCAFHTPMMANYWLHNGFLQVEGEKMAKSEGNFITIREALSGWKGRSWPGNAIRLAMIDTHYRQPINWTLEKLHNAEMDLFRFAGGMFGLVAGHFGNNIAAFASFLQSARVQVPIEIVDALFDDLNTPAALSLIRQRIGLIQNDPQTALGVLAAFELLGITSRDRFFLNQSPAVHGIFDINEIRETMSVGRDLAIALINHDLQASERIATMLAQREINVRNLGMGMLLLQRDRAQDRTFQTHIEKRISERNAARKAKNFKEADRIRDELHAMGIELEDHKDGTTSWKVKR